MKYIALFLLWLPNSILRAQQAGYREIRLTDSTRRYKSSAQAGDRLYNRPVEIDCWYPARSTNKLPIRFGEFLQLFEQRANRFQDDTSFTGLAAQTAQYLCSGLGIKDSSQLTAYETRSYRDAPPRAGPYPLIIYMTSYNGMCFENIWLFETLASHGYIVASITSVGRYPGNMTTDPADLQEQVADGLLAINKLESTDVGVIGYSWGGPAALLLAKDPRVKTILSLDGSEFHYYGEPDADDSNFNRVRPLLPATPPNYAYLESDNKQGDGTVDSIFHLRPQKYVRFAGSTHEDFSCLPYLAAIIGKKDTVKLPDYPFFAVRWLDNHLKNAANQFLPNSSWPVVSADKRQTISAKVLDPEDKTPLAFVNVGIPNKNIGTVTSEDGVFHLTVPTQFLADTLAISMAGYSKCLIPIKATRDTILLSRRAAALVEAVVLKSVPRKKILGNTTTSNKISVGFPMRFLGAEIGVKIAMGKTPRRLRMFHCHLTGSRVDSAIYRLNIYRFYNGNPENVLQNNILLSVGNKPGDYSLNLAAQNLILSGDILVSLELLRSYSATPNTGAVYFSAAFFNSGTWRRSTSQAAWRKARGIGVGFNLEVR